MARIHHNTLKKAAKLGITLCISMDGTVVAMKGNKELARAADPKDALDLAILTLNPPKVAKSTRSAPKKTAKPRETDDMDEAEFQEEFEDEIEPEDESRSVVKAKYKTKYRPRKMTCGDTLAQQVRDRFMTQKDEDTGRPRLDFNAFVAFAKANECWVEGYRSLKDKHGNRNHGLIRMNVVNRLRAKVRHGHKVMW